MVFSVVDENAVLALNRERSMHEQHILDVLRLESMISRAHEGCESISESLAELMGSGGNVMPFKKNLFIDFKRARSGYFCVFK